MFVTPLTTVRLRWRSSDSATIHLTAGRRPVINGNRLNIPIINWLINKYYILIKWLKLNLLLINNNTASLFSLLTLSVGFLGSSQSGWFLSMCDFRLALVLYIWNKLKKCNNNVSIPRPRKYFEVSYDYFITVQTHVHFGFRRNR